MFAGIWRKHGHQEALGQLGDSPHPLEFATCHRYQRIYCATAAPAHWTYYLVRGVDSVGDSHVYALSEVMRTEPVVAYADEPLRFAVYRMAEFGYTRFPVVDRAHPDQLLGILSLRDLLKARAHTLDEERRRERTLNLRMLFSPPRSAEPERELERV